MNPSTPQYDGMMLVGVLLRAVGILSIIGSVIFYFQHKSKIDLQEIVVYISLSGAISGLVIFGFGSLLIAVRDIARNSWPEQVVTSESKPEKTADAATKPPSLPPPSEVPSLPPVTNASGKWRIIGKRKVNGDAIDTVVNAPHEQAARKAAATAGVIVSRVESV